MTGRRIVAFAGPSLRPADRQRPDIEWRGPAAAGDLLATLPQRPDAICLIDGLFDACAAPWHKELLLVMAHGVRLFGAASMGALRAAELHRHGMTGVGRIFEAYRDGRLSGDDEVALVHATERLGWAALTVPMVEVRATLWRACRAGLIAPGRARLIRSAVHDIHYEDRDWPVMEQRCTAAGLIDRERFARLETLHVRLKRADALKCLDAAAAARRPARGPMPPVTCFTRALVRQRGVEWLLEDEPLRQTADPRNSRGTDDAAGPTPAVRRRSDPRARATTVRYGFAAD